MLGNVAPVRETVLAAMQLGAVIVPATTLLIRDNLLYRFEHGRARHVMTSAGHAGKFAELRAGEATHRAAGTRDPAEF